MTPSKISAFLNSMLEDNSGGYSTMRVLLVLVVLSVLVVWVSASFRAPSGTIPELPTNVLAFVGSFVAAKAVQRFGEQPVVEPPTTPPPTA